MCHVCRRLGIKDQTMMFSSDSESEDEDVQEEEDVADADAQLKDEGNGRKKQVAGRWIPDSTVVVEKAPSHDGSPTFAAWPVWVTLLDSENSKSPPSKDPEKHRPAFGMRIYDTTADATAERTALLARRISELTYDYRMSSDSYEGDRIEVVMFPLPAQTTADERATACIAHNEAERAVRLAMPDPTLAVSWYIVEDFEGASNPSCCRKKLWAIDDLKESWEEAVSKTDTFHSCLSEERQGAHGIHGHFQDVIYDREFYDSEDEELQSEGKPRPEFFAARMCLEKLGQKLFHFRGVRGNVYQFHKVHFIPHGVLEKELAAGRAAAATGTERG